MRDLQETVTTGDEVFDVAANNWLNACRQLFEETVNLNASAACRHSIQVEMGGSIYLRIWDNHQSCWAFLALKDNESKGMGQVRRGDVFKPDSWKRPAKHARGNIFDTSRGPTCGVYHWTGPRYIRAGWSTNSIGAEVWGNED